MEKLSGGETLAKSLTREGVEVVFGIPGIQTHGIVAGIRDEPGIRMVTTRHEQATTYMAGLDLTLIPGPVRSAF